jgi:RsiW-degrading membrane proteinase PrsW (M82 family)
MCTFGVTSEFLKYIAIRYTVFPSRIRNRMDGIAYSIAASVGYATVVNMHVVFALEPTVSADAVRIAINFVAQVSFGVIMGYFLSEVALHQRNWFFLGIGLVMGAFIHGLYIAFRGIAAGSGLNVQNVRGLLLVIFFAMLVTAAINFIVATLDMREAALAGERRLR